MALLFNYQELGKPTIIGKEGKWTSTADQQTSWSGKLAIGKSYTRVHSNPSTEGASGRWWKTQLGHNRPAQLIARTKSSHASRWRSELKIRSSQLHFSLSHFSQRLGFWETWSKPGMYTLHFHFTFVIENQINWKSWLTQPFTELTKSSNGGICF